ncbi:MAG: hypothetical protein HN778_07695 [Prolixibacteraceae bacterium]|jgi:hypothetical protein|nr:hypothetical protein [Prolixibacteraceae bacterium]MBT6006255.1 hypothetical protein [Prolixibacteraceae bacterium]MBT6764718.1 hypothetical protein [Prolixibacteraceae bacterium]MBT6997288.1 hypothetical protein [Prolixibacteraceae bacterium]MBT7394700.1 hypothetical protein [Prolixibacteraceae bacterium]
MKKLVPYLIAIALTAFGLITLFLSSSVIFDLFGIREKEGNYVLLVVWANFLSSILYLFAAYGFIKNSKWTAKYLVASVVILVAAFIGLLIHINGGGIHETKTIGAMLVRTSITIVFLILAYFTICKPRREARKLNEQK